MSETLTDQDILDLINVGVIAVQGTDVWKSHGGRLRMVRLKPQRHPESGRARFNIRWRGRSRTIYRNRIVYLNKHRELVPDGFDVIHKNHNRFDDSPDNIDVQDAAGNRRDNTFVGFVECVDFFNRMLAMQLGSLGDF